MFLKPDYNLKSIYDIDLDDLKKQGIKALLFDLDSTIMASKSAKYTDETKKWLDNVRKDFFIAVISNNYNPAYIEKVKAVTDFPALFDAKKPKSETGLAFLKEHNINVSEAVMIGDRPLTDVLFGKRLGCKTILVDSITAKTEKKVVRFVRKLERLCIKP